MSSLKKKTPEYYIPTIEEFHVGFEYECFREGDSTPDGVLTTFPKEESNWYKFTFPDPYYGFHTGKLFVHNTLRVKCLDREDIESLGWKFNEAYVYGEEQVFFKSDYIITYIPNSASLLFEQGEHSVFTVWVKNKSELKKLMEQLKISDGKI